MKIIFILLSLLVLTPSIKNNQNPYSFRLKNSIIKPDSIDNAHGTLAIYIGSNSNIYGFNIHSFYINDSIVFYQDPYDLKIKKKHEYPYVISSYYNYLQNYVSDIKLYTNNLVEPKDTNILLKYFYFKSNNK